MGGGMANRVVRPGDISPDDGAAQILGGGQAQPLSMAKGNFVDGIEDLVVGYVAPGGGVIAFHRGSLDAFAPQSDASFQAIGRGEFPAPFLPEARVFRVPVRPDFIAVGSFTGQGNQDLIVAAKGGNALYLFAGDGKGNFAAPQIVNLPGGVTALAAGDFGNKHQSTLMVGVSGPKSPFSLLVYQATPKGLTSLAGYSLSAPAANILFTDFGGPGPDAAFLSGGRVQILRSSSMQLASVSLPVNAAAMALGSFIYDRNGTAQIALLGSDGSVQIAVRNDFDPRTYTVDEVQVRREARNLGKPDPIAPVRSFPANGWKIVDSFPAVASVAPSQTPVFFRTRISSNGADDIMWLSAATGQMVVISHYDPPSGATTFLPGQVSVKPYSGSPISAVPMRINVDGRPGIMALHRGDVVPTMVMPIPDPTFFVNTFADPAPGAPAATCNNVSFVDLSSSCSLREAVIKASGDTIMLQAGTYTLTRAKVGGDFSGNNRPLYVNANLTIARPGQTPPLTPTRTTAINP